MEFYSCRKLGERVHMQDFAVCVWLWWLSILLSIFLFVVDLTVWIHLHVGCFSSLTQLRNRLPLVSPRFWFVVGSFTFLGCCGFLLSHFGHDRAKNNSGIKFPSQSCVLPKLSPRLFGGVWFSSLELWIACFAVCMQWLVFGLCWSGNEGLVCLINLVCLGAT